MRLRIEQRLPVDDVELNVMPVHRKIRADESGQVVQSLFSGQGRRCKLLVQERAAGRDVVHLRTGSDDSRRSVRIRMLFRRDALGHRLVRQTSVRCSTDHAAEIYVAGRRQHVDAVGPALHVRPSRDGVAEQCEGILHDVIGVIIIVAVLRCFFRYEMVNILISLEVVIHGLHQLMHRELLLIVHIVFHGGKRIRHRADADALDIVCIIPRTAGIVIPAFLNAVVCHDGQAGCRHVFRIQTLYHVVAADLDLDDVLHLSAESIPQLIPGPEIFRTAELQADLLSGDFIVAVVECELKNLRDIQISGEDICLIAPAAGLHASGGAALTRIFQRFPCVQKLLDDLIGIVKCRLAPALARDLAGALQEFLRRLLADLHIGVRLNEFHLVHAVKNQIAHAVDAVRAVLRHTAGVDIRKIRVGAALLQRDADLDRCRLIVELHPQALQQFQCLTVIQSSGFHIRLVERVQMLIQTSRAESVPRIQLRRHGQMREPVVLDRLPVGLRPVRGNDLEVLHHLKQLGFTFRIRTFFRLGGDQIVITLSKDADSVAVDLHGLELFSLIQCLRIIHEIQMIDRILNICLMFHVSFGEHIPAAAGVARTSLLHKFREHARVVAVSPRRGHAGKQTVTHGFALPVGNNDLLLVSDILLRHLKGYQLPVVHDVHVFDRMTAELRKCRRCLRVSALFSDDQLSLAEVKCLSGKIFLQHQCSQHRKGYFVFVFFVHFGLNLRPLQINMRRGFHAHSAQLTDSVIHTAFFHVLLSFRRLPAGISAVIFCAACPCCLSVLSVCVVCPCCLCSLYH